MRDLYSGKPRFNKWGQFGKDYEEGINFDRLRRERLQKAQDALIKHDLGAMVAMRVENTRYITGFKGLPIAATVLRYVVLPRGGEPVIFELGGDYGRLKESVTWIREENITTSYPIFATAQNGTPVELEVRERVSHLWAEGIRQVLKDHGVEHERIGFDFLFDTTMVRALERAGINYVDGQFAMIDARSVKTEDELQLLSIASQIAEAGFYTIEHAMRPGIRECEIWAEANRTMIALGAENVEGICTTGGRTNPYYRLEGTDKILRPGDLLITDIVISYMGYHTCVVRTFLTGNRPTSEQKRIYRACYDSLQKSIEVLRPGIMTDAVAGALPRADWGNYSLNIGHGLGLAVHETPSITEPYSMEAPTEIRDSTYLALETFAGDPDSDQGVRLEENILVAGSGYEIFSRYPFDEKLLN
jgi:Xaa-Pro aminopeptidase